MKYERSYLHLIPKMCIYHLYVFMARYLSKTIPLLFLSSLGGAFSVDVRLRGPNGGFVLNAFLSLWKWQMHLSKTLSSTH